MAPKAADLSQSGITAVWLPPPTESVAPQGWFFFFGIKCEIPSLFICSSMCNFFCYVIKIGIHVSNGQLQVNPFCFSN